MDVKNDITLSDVQAVYTGPEGELWELIMGEQIHVGGFASSMDLAEKAEIKAGSTGVDLCCCTGAGMRFLIRFCDVAFMYGVDATEKVIELGKKRNAEEGLAGKIEFINSDVCKSPLKDGIADFVWGEDAWCYVADKKKLIEEACRIVKSKGIIVFTDWLIDEKSITESELKRLLVFMKFSNMQTIDGYKKLLEDNNCQILFAQNTGRFAPCIDLYLNKLNMQETYDALKIINFDAALMQTLSAEMQFMQQLAHQGKILQGLFVARKKN